MITIKPKIIVNGAFGKMGSLTALTLKGSAEFELIASLGSKDSLPYALEKYKPDIVIEFTNSDSVYKNSKVIVESGARAIIGASGLSLEQIDFLKAQCEEKKLGSIIAPNFSLAALVMMKAAQFAAKYFPEVEIIETHHQQKLDSPSATALKTAEIIAKNSTKEKGLLPGKEKYPGARGATYQNIPIHSLRLPGFIASQKVIFGSLGEHLTIAQDSIDRQCFMPGVLMACQKVMQLESLVYGLEHLLD